MKYHILLTILSALFLISACNRAETTYWPNGNKKTEIVIRGSRYDGPASYWYENGNLQTACTYKDDKLEGKLTSYYASGKLQLEQNYKSGKLHGRALTYDKLGKLLSEAGYQDDKLHGRYLEFYPDKTLRVEGQYFLGDHDGTWFYYGQDGLVIGEGTFTRGNGVQKAFYSNGVAKQITYYSQNQKDGDEIFYKPDGSVDFINIYRNGKLIDKKKK